MSILGEENHTPCCSFPNSSSLTIKGNRARWAKSDAFPSGQNTFIPAASRGVHEATDGFVQKTSKTSNVLSLYIGFTSRTPLNKSKLRSPVEGLPQIKYWKQISLPKDLTALILLWESGTWKSTMALTWIGSSRGLSGAEATYGGKACRIRE